MEYKWVVDSHDIQKASEFIYKYRQDPFVLFRIKKNIQKNRPETSKETVWKAMVSCLITTQQRSGPKSAVTRFINCKPFPLDYQVCVLENEVFDFTRNVITKFGGLRRSNKIAEELNYNLDLLERGEWKELLNKLSQLDINDSFKLERQVAEYINDSYKGFGPKQSRNLLQSLGLSKYEIPIDSRIIKWLNDFGFPIKLSANSLSDKNYYNFISDGIRALCEEINKFPCVLDAAIFASFDDGGWSEHNVIW